MSFGQVFAPKAEEWTVSPSLLAKSAVLAILLGSALAMSGVAGIFVALTLCMLILFGAFATRFPAPALGAAICCLGLVPYDWGLLMTGVLPKLFGDESLLLLYLAAFPFLYLFTSRTWQRGFGAIYLLLALLLFSQALSFIVAADLVSLRNFFETYVLGALLLVLFLQEGAQSDPEDVARVIVPLTVLIAALSVLERIVQRNPVMENSNGLYLSPEIVRLAGGVYRPYVGFFHPSEAGTFIALGAPFAVRAWQMRKSWLALLGLSTIAAGLFVNATRGVWFAVIIAALLALRRFWKWLLVAAPAAAIAGWITYLALQESPFMKRLSDPQDLWERLEYWKIGAKIVIAHPFIGVGHMKFKSVYFDYVKELNGFRNFDIAHAFAPDNMFLSTAVEHGLLGLFALLVFFGFAAILLRIFRERLAVRGLTTQASYICCCEFVLLIYAGTGFFADVELFTKATKLIFILLGLGLAEGGRAANRVVSSMAQAAPIATGVE